MTKTQTESGVQLSVVDDLFKFGLAGFAFDLKGLAEQYYIGLELRGDWPGFVASAKSSSADTSGQSQ